MYDIVVIFGAALSQGRLSKVYRQGDDGVDRPGEGIVEKGWSDRRSFQKQQSNRPAVKHGDEANCRHAEKVPEDPDFPTSTFQDAAKRRLIGRASPHSHILGPPRSSGPSAGAKSCHDHDQRKARGKWRFVNAMSGPHQLPEHGELLISVGGGRPWVWDGTDQSRGRLLLESVNLTLQSIDILAC